MKVLNVVGARPNFMKIAPIIEQMKKAADLDSIQNRLWFTLRHGNCPHPTLQAAWTVHGAETFAMEIIERLDEETLSYVRDRVLKDRLAHWCSAFGAEGYVRLSYATSREQLNHGLDRLEQWLAT